MNTCLECGIKDCSPECQRKAWPTHKTLCRKAVATKDRDEEGIRAHPDRIPLAGTFESYIQKHEQAIHFALYSAFQIGAPEGDLHLSHIAIGLFHCDPDTKPLKFNFLGLRLLSHAEYHEEKLANLPADDPHRIQHEALLSQKGLNEYWDYAGADAGMARCAAVMELSDAPLPTAGSDFAFTAVCQIAAPFVIELREFPGSPPFPVDPDFLQHLDEDLNVPTPMVTREEMKERQIKRLGSVGASWVKQSADWFDALSDEKKMEMKIMLGGGESS
ncbi:hypothetical protein RQP46_004372 [Phenoliferia psychrophenolica]